VRDRLFFSTHSFARLFFEGKRQDFLNFDYDGQTMFRKLVPVQR